MFAILPKERSDVIVASFVNMLNSVGRFSLLAVSSTCNSFLAKSKDAKILEVASKLESKGCKGFICCGDIGAPISSTVTAFVEGTATVSVKDSCKVFSFLLDSVVLVFCGVKDSLDLASILDTSPSSEIEV